MNKIVARMVLPMLAATALPGAASAISPGAGWSRAPDIAVYGAMRVFARKAVEQDVLCHGRAPERASAMWAHDFGARQAWVDDAMARKYGAATMARLPTPFTPRISCTAVPDPRWENQFARLLRLLEIRLGLTPEREG
jgi:hypothetical protein